MKYKPHDYQKFAVDFIETHPEAAVLLECGLGKTSITLTALNDLMFDKFEVRKVLIIAPIRVCKNSWAAEIAKWDHLEGLNYSLVLGSREQRLFGPPAKGEPLAETSTSSTVRMCSGSLKAAECRLILTWSLLTS